eukprot:SAG25_NODE_142_length_14075_cov_38.666070_7_plen_81_part_00
MATNPDALVVVLPRMMVVVVLGGCNNSRYPAEVTRAVVAQDHMEGSSRTPKRACVRRVRRARCKQRPMQVLMFIAFEVGL